METTVETGGGEAVPDTDDIVQTDAPQAVEQQIEEPELEEVEHDGKTYKIPKVLKGALLMQADYTRKTQEVAEQRRAIEEQQRQFAEQQKQQAEHLTEFARVVAFNDALARFEQTDWPQIRAQNPQLFNDLWFQYQQTKEQRDRAVVALQQKLQERNSAAQRETARRAEESRAAIAREIRDWSPELAGKLTQFGMSLGFKPEELSAVTDIRMVKLLHAAFLAHQAEIQQAAARKAANAEAAKPLTTVSSGSSGGKVKASDAASDRLSTDEWMKRRNSEVKHRRETRK